MEMIKGNMEMINELGKENEAIKNMIYELKSEKEGQATVIQESKKIIARFKGQVGRLMNQNRVLVKENGRLDQMIKKVQAEAWEREDSLVLRVMMVEFRHRRNTLQLSSRSKGWLFKKVGRLNLPRFQNFIEQGNMVGHDYPLEKIAHTVENFFDDNGKAALKELFEALYEKTVESSLPPAEDEDLCDDDDDDDDADAVED
jgi:hypothetical protein